MIGVDLIIRVLSMCYGIMFLFVLSCADETILLTDIREKENQHFLKNTSTPFSGMAVEYHPDGTTKKQVEFDEGEIKISVEWYEGGQKKQEER